MSITAQELASIIERASVGATPNEENLARNVAKEIRRARQDASKESESSRSLQSMVDASSEELGSRAISQLRMAHIYGYESTYINAIPDTSVEKKIIVFDGLKHLIYYHIALVKVLDQLLKHRAKAKYSLPNGEVISEAL